MRVGTRLRRRLILGSRLFFPLSSPTSWWAGGMSDEIEKSDREILTFFHASQWNATTYLHYLARIKLAQTT